MPLDARIPLQAIGIQAPDVLGAMAQGQQYRQNQMAQQAAQTAAQRNAMIRQRAAATDFTNPGAVNSFVREVGPDATPYLEAAAAGAGLGTARSAETRAQGEYDRKAGEAAMTELRTVVGRVWSNPSDANLASAAAQYPQFAADISRIAALPPEARQGALGTMVAALPGGSDFLASVTQTYDDMDLGGSIRRTPKRSYLPGETQTFATTADPRAPQIFSSSQGVGQIGSDGTFTPATNPDGTPVMPYVAPSSTQNGQTQANADLNRSRATGIMRDSAATMRGALTTLRDEGFLRSSRDNAATGAGQFIRDAIPGGRGLALSMNPTADAAAQVIQGTRSTMVGQLKDMYGSSSRAMDAVKELELALAQFGAEGGNYDAGVSLLSDLERRLDLIDRLYREDSGLAGGGGNAALEAEARRRGLIP